MEKFNIFLRILLLFFHFFPGNLRIPEREKTFTLHWRKKESDSDTVMNTQSSKVFPGNGVEMGHEQDGRWRRGWHSWHGAGKGWPKLKCFFFLSNVISEPMILLGIVTTILLDNYLNKYLIFALIWKFGLSLFLVKEKKKHFLYLEFNGLCYGVETC